MGTLVIPTGFAEVDIEFDISANQEAHVVFGVDQGGALTAQNIADNVLAALVAANAEAFISATRNIVGVSVKANIGGTVFLAQTASGIIGVASGTAASPQVAFLLKKTTGLAGRANHGRMYWPYIADSQVDENGAVDATALGNFQTFADDLLTELQNLDVPMVLLHGGAVPATPTPVTLLVAQTTVATQRRRLR